MLHAMACKPAFLWLGVALMTLASSLAAYAVYGVIVRHFARGVCG